MNPKRTRMNAKRTRRNAKRTRKECEGNAKQCEGIEAMRSNAKQRDRMLLFFRPKNKKNDFSFGYLRVPSDPFAYLRIPSRTFGYLHVPSDTFTYLRVLSDSFALVLIRGNPKEREGTRRNKCFFLFGYLKFFFPTKFFDFF